MTTVTTPTAGWKCFNTSNGEWEWCAEMPQECEGATEITPCTWEQFCKIFPYQDTIKNIHEQA